MKKARRYLMASQVCGVGFLCLLPKTVQALQDIGIKADTRFGEAAPLLLLMAQRSPLLGVALALLLLAVALLVMGVVLASVSRSPSDSR